jgi:enoyl-CoA hydratase
MISGIRAYELGLVSILLEGNNFLEEAKEITKKIAEKPKSSLIEIKKLISISRPFEQGLDDERKSFYELLDHENAKIGIDAFLKKSKADWKD